MHSKLGVIIYALAFIILLIMHYLVPYTILKNAKDFSLFLYWSMSVFLWIVVTVVIIERGWFK